MYVTKQITRFSHAIHAARLVQMPSKKRRGRVGFSPATARREKPKKSLSSDWAENLAESNKGLIQPSTECNPSASTSTFSARRSTENYG